MNAFEEIHDFVRGLAVIDTHEHLPGREEERDRDTDVLKEYLFHYFNRDLLSAGLPAADYARVVEPRLPLMERWRLVEPYWEAARHTGYGRALDLSARGLYGLERIDGSTIEELNRRFLESLRPGHYEEVLHRRCRIRTCLLDSVAPLELGRDHLGADPRFFRSVYRPDVFVRPRLLAEVQQVERALQREVTSFEGWLEACEEVLERALARGAVALKCSLAYERSLSFERVPRAEAEASFHQVLRSRHLPDWTPAPLATSKAFQDYMMHFILGLADRRGLAFQFHTGLQEGCGNLLAHSDPLLLSNLFAEYPRVRFDLFHMGYPWQQVVSALAKNYPNVFIDMCWAHIVSPAACVAALEEWLDAVPCNKISAFGGDYHLVDGIFGHLELARLDVSRALARKVADGVFDVERAKGIARMLFHDNPLRIFRLEGALPPMERGAA